MIGEKGERSQSEIEGVASLLLRLRRDGIADTNLLTAVEQTPRSRFVPTEHADVAYSARLVPIECGGFMEGADLMVQLVSALDLEKGQRVLEIGTGSGFATAIMARLVDRVVTVERYRTLLALAQKRLEYFALKNVAFRHADGSQGVPGEGTFDRIFVAGAFESVPRNFVDHLAPNGMMLAGIRKEDGRVHLSRLTRIGNRFERTDGAELPYLPLIRGIAARI